MPVVPISPPELNRWRQYIRELCGVDLDQTKGYLIETRLGNLLQETGSQYWDDLLNKVRQPALVTLRTKVINSITTNETSFFRDTTPFDLLRHKLIPELIDRRKAAGIFPLPIRILSAACSTGQELYSICIMLKELLIDFRSYDVRLMGIDISEQAIAKASYGCYEKFELDRGIKADKLPLYFEAVDNRWKIRDELRVLTSFRRANLLEPPQVAIPFDIVLCRNVAIYFADTDRIKLFRNMDRMLARDGALIIGSTESIAGLCPEFEPKRYLRTVFYQKLH